MKKFSPRIVWVVAFLVVGFALASAVFFSSRTGPARAGLGAVRQVERAAEPAPARQEIRPEPGPKLEQLAGLDRGLASLLKPAAEWLAPDDSRPVEQVASVSAEHAGAGLEESARKDE